MIPSVHEDIDVVVVQFGPYDVLARCLGSLENGRQRPGRTIVIVNGIEGAPVEQIRRDHPSVEVVVNSENVGYSRAANQGLKLSTAAFVVLLNNDVVVDEGWLAPLRRTAFDHPQAALVQPKVLSLANPMVFDYSGAAGGFIDGYGYPCARGRLFDRIESDTGQYDDECELFWASGAALLIDRSAALAVGGFDENFFIFHEESDLAWRLHLQGRTTWFCPTSRVYHVGSASFNASLPSARLKYYMMHRNDLIMVAKNWEGRELRFRFPVRLLLEVVSWTYLLYANRTELREAARGLAWVALNSRKVREMRRGVQSRRTHPDASYRHLMVRGILPLRRFVGREMRFSELDRYPPAKGGVP